MKKIYFVFFCLLFAFISDAQVYYGVGAAGTGYTPPNGATYTYTTPGTPIKTLTNISDFLTNGGLPNGTTEAIFELQTDYFETMNTTVIFTYSGTAKITIRPVLGSAGFYISGDPGAGSPLILLNGAKNLIFDGRRTSSETLRRWGLDNKGSGAVFEFINGAQSNVITYMDLRCGITDPSAGTVFFGPGLGGNNNNFNIVDHNYFLGSTSGDYYMNGVASDGAFNSNNEIKNNDFENFTIGGVLLTNSGSGDTWKIDQNNFYKTNLSTLPITVIEINGGINHKITGNNIGGGDNTTGGASLKVVSAASTVFTGISVAVGGASESTEIGNNKIDNIWASNDNTSNTAFYGIRVKTGGTNVYNNKFGGFNKIVTEGNTFGISMEGSGGNQVINNTIENLRGEMPGSYEFVAVKITGAGHYKVWNNTINSTNYPINNTNNNPLNASTAIFYDGGGTADIYLNLLSFANFSSTDKAPATIIAVNNGSNVKIFSNRIFGGGDYTGTKNGKLDSDAGYSYGIYQRGGVMHVYSNYLALGSENVENVRGIEINADNLNGSEIYNNNVFIGGVNITANSTNSYAFYRHPNVASGSLTLKNNLFYNARPNNDAYAIGIGDATGWGPGSGNDIGRNMYISTSDSKIGDLGGTDLKYDDWIGFTQEPYCYSLTNTDVPALQFFENADPLASGDLRIKETNSFCWYLRGKAENIGQTTDYAGTSWNGIFDIGAYKINPSGAGLTPPNAIISGAHTPGNVEVIIVAGLKVAEITWGNTGTLPVLNYVKHYTGVQAPNLPAPAMPGGTVEALAAYWDIDATGGNNYTYSVKLFFDPVNAGTLGLDGDATVFKKSGGGNWVNKSLTTRDYTENWFQITGETSFSIFTAADASSVLPVALHYFNAEKRNSDVVLNWKAASETNHAYYEAQRSYDGLNFTSFKAVKPTGIQSYTETDAGILLKQSGKIYYRLKMISTANTATYSAVAVIDNSNAILSPISVLSPNPFEGHIDLLFNNTKQSDTRVMLFNAEGKPVKTISVKLPAGSSSVRLSDLQNLPAGVFMLSVQSGENKLQTKMLKK